MNKWLMACSFSGWPLRVFVLRGRLIRASYAARQEVWRRRSDGLMRPESLVLLIVAFLVVLAGLVMSGVVGSS